MEIGSRVRIVKDFSSVFAGLPVPMWWPKGEVTGTVQKFFKNGRVAVAVDQLPNRSNDGRATINFRREEIETL